MQIELLVLDNNTWNHLTVCKQISSSSFKNNVTDKRFVYKSYMCISMIWLSITHKGWYAIKYYHQTNQQIMIIIFAINDMGYDQKVS